MRTVLTAFLILTALAGHARAGGMLVEYADAAPQATQWTGCYGGGHLGGAWGTSDKWLPRTPGGAFEGVSLGGHDVDGFIGGVQVGCDYQLSNGIVLGIGGNYGWTDADGTHPSARETGVFYHSETEGLGALTGRLGYAFGDVLLYVEGGAAWERVSYAASTTQIGTAYRATYTRHGWTIGGGGEYPITTHLSASNTPITTSAPSELRSTRNTASCRPLMWTSTTPPTSSAQASISGLDGRRPSPAAIPLGGQLELRRGSSRRPGSGWQFLVPNVHARTAIDGPASG